MPKRIQLKRTKGWKKPEGTIVVARPSKWGNPIEVGSLGQIDVIGRDDIGYSATVKITPQIAVLMFASEIRSRLESDDPDLLEHTWQWLQELRGHDLACWCPLDSPCHADLLLEIANAR